MSASASSLSVALPAPGFEVVRGEPVIGGLHGASRHYHCPHCKSWLFTRPEGMDDLVNLRASALRSLRSAWWWLISVPRYAMPRMARRMRAWDAS